MKTEVDAWRAGERPGIIVSDLLLRRYGEGAFIPHGWGLAYREFHRECSVFMPIPFNVLVATARRVYLWLRFGVKWGNHPREHRIWIEARDQGLDIGKRIGRAEGVKLGIEQGRTEALDVLRAIVEE